MHQAVTARSNRVRRALSHRRALQLVPAGHVVWVYAITDDLAPDQLDGLTGVAGERVRAVAAAGLTAVVGSVDARVFGEQARARLMADLPSIERLGRAHHQVIACVAAGGPVLPLRLATVYPDDQTVCTLLGRSSAQFAVILDSFRGTEEWGVKVYAGAEDAAGPQPAQEAQAFQEARAGRAGQEARAGRAGQEARAGRAGQEAQAAQPGPAGETAGRPGILPCPGDRVVSRSEAGEPDGDLTTPIPPAEKPPAENAGAFAGMIDRALAGIAIASRHQTAPDPSFDGSGKCLVLNAAYLVLSDRAGEFTAVARALAGAHQGLGADLTGPWPPYSFADIRPA